jgi:hypothetical protein
MSGISVEVCGCMKKLLIKTWEGMLILINADKKQISIVFYCSSISICRLYGEEYVHMVGWLINNDHTGRNVKCSETSWKHPSWWFLWVRSVCNSHAANSSTIQRGSNFHRCMLTILLKTITAKKRNKMLKEKIKQSPYF